MQFKSKKPVIALSVLLCTLVLASSFGGTWAYLTDRDSKRNSFVVGETATSIIEEYEPPAELKPGVSFTKKPSVQNVGNLPCYVRMRTDFSDSRMQNLCEPLDINTADWEYSAADGYYYYKTLLQPGETTTALFTTVKIKTKDSNGNDVVDADMKDFDILIYSESTQHIDHSGSHPSNEYRTVWL